MKIMNETQDINKDRDRGEEYDLFTGSSKFALIPVLFAFVIILLISPQINTSVSIQVTVLYSFKK